MKFIRFFSALSAVLLLSGCVSHNLPKDSYMQGVHSKIVTPWGTGEMLIDMAATGTAAKNVTLPEPPPAKPAPKSATTPSPVR